MGTNPHADETSQRDVGQPIDCSPTANTFCSSDGLGAGASTADEVEYVSDAFEAIQSSIGRSRERQKRVLELIMQDEVAHAKRLAECLRKSAQLECPELAGGCGSDANFVPITCDSRLCPECARRKLGQEIAAHRSSIERMAYPTLLTLTIENVEDLVRGKEAIQGAFGRLRRRKLPPEGGKGSERWVWGHDGGTPVKYQWKRMLRAVGAHDVARRMQKQYVEQGRWIPFDELVAGGLYGIDIKEQEAGRYHVHLHAVIDCPYVPQPVISSVWEDLTGASVVDIRRVEGRDGVSLDEALAEVVGYVCKPPEFASVESEVAYLKALKGSRLVQPFGSLHGQTERPSGLLRCCDCGCAPQWWNYLGIVDEAYDTMTPTWEETGDRPPPDE